MTGPLACCGGCNGGSEGFEGGIDDGGGVEIGMVAWFCCVGVVVWSRSGGAGGCTGGAAG